MFAVTVQRQDSASTLRWSEVPDPKWQGVFMVWKGGLGVWSRWAVAAAATTVITLGAGSTAGAIPEHKAETWVCEGQEVTLVGTGRSGWIDGVHYLAGYLEFTGVFTPEGGGEPDVAADPLDVGGAEEDPQEARRERRPDGDGRAEDPGEERREPTRMLIGADEAHEL